MQSEGDQSVESVDLPQLEGNDFVDTDTNELFFGSEKNSLNPAIHETGPRMDMPVVDGNLSDDETMPSNSSRTQTGGTQPRNPQEPELF